MLAPTVLGGGVGTFKPPAPVISRAVAPRRLSQLERFRIEAGTALQAVLDRLQPAEGIFKPKAGKWYTPKVKDRHGNTRLAILSHTAIERAYASGYGRSPMVIGLRFKRTTYHGLIDLDSGSPHRTPERLQEFIQAAADLGLVITPCQSSESEGWHLYVTTLEAIPCAQMSAILKAIAHRGGVETIRDGQCEVYPNTDDPDQAVRLPGQANFGFLRPYDGQLEVLFDASTPAENIRRVLWMFTEQANSPEAIAQALEAVSPADDVATTDTIELGKTQEVVEYPTAKGSPGRPSKAKKGKTATYAKSLDTPIVALVMGHDRNARQEGSQLFHDPENEHGIRLFNEGRHYYRKGLNETSTRYTATKAVNFYLLFAGFTNRSDRKAELRKWIAEKHNGYSEAWNRGQVETVFAEIDRLVDSRAKNKATGQQSKIIDFYQAANRRKKGQARAKLEQAIADLKTAGKKPTYQAIVELTGLSTRTIAKHLRELEEANRTQSEEITNKETIKSTVISCKAEASDEAATASEPTEPPLEGWPAGYVESALGLVNHLAKQAPAYAEYHAEVVMALSRAGHTDTLQLAAVNVQHLYRSFRQGIAPQEAAAEVQTDCPMALKSPTVPRRLPDASRKARRALNVLAVG